MAKINSIKKIEQWLPIAHPNDNSGGIYLNRIYRLVINSEDYELIENLRNDLSKFNFHILLSLNILENHFIHQMTHNIIINGSYLK